MSSLKTTGTIPSAVYPTAGTLISAFAVGALIGGPPFF